MASLLKRRCNRHISKGAGRLSMVHLGAAPELLSRGRGSAEIQTAGCAHHTKPAGAAFPDAELNFDGVVGLILAP
jgi:hypothetical protein